MGVQTGEICREIFTEGTGYKIDRAVLDGAAAVNRRHGRFRADRPGDAARRHRGRRQKGSLGTDHVLSSFGRESERDHQPAARNKRYWRSGLSSGSMYICVER